MKGNQYILLKNICSFKNIYNYCKIIFKSKLIYGKIIFGGNATKCNWQKCWNWQTGWSQKPVFNHVWVQVPSSAPN